MNRSKTPLWSAIAAATFSCAISISAFAKTYQVFEVRKNLAMYDGEPTYHDYYVNAGSAEGLKVGALILVKRRLPVHNSYSDTNEDMYLPVAQIRLIHVQRNVSIGRIVKPYSAKEYAVVDHFTIMAGDLIDVLSNGDDGRDSRESKENRDSKEDRGAKDSKPSAKEVAKALPQKEDKPAQHESNEGSLYPKDGPAILNNQ